MRVIDGHAHLEDLPNLDSELAAAKEAGVVAVIAVGSDERSNEFALDISRRYSGFVFPALGLHPWNLRENFGNMLESIKNDIDNCVALGEVGLDFKMPKPKELQIAAFKGVLELAKRFEKPVIIHSRWAWREAFELVKESGVKRVVFHWYSGPLDILHEVLDFGCYVSATPAATYSEYHIPAIAEVPLDRLLLETDTPVVYRGMKSSPKEVVRVVKAVAQIKGTSEEEVAETTTKNAARLFGLKV
jgi:TatD DNase family protein